MDWLKYLLSTATRIDSALKLWAFLIPAIIIIVRIILFSPAFQTVFSENLRKSDRYKIIKLTLTYITILSSLFLVLLFISPILLKKIEIREDIESPQIDYVILEDEQHDSLFDSALVIFKNTKNYDKARLIFKSLYKQAEDEESKEYLRGLITASYYGAERHREGLEYICSLYSSLPKTNHRYRFDIHAHIRKIAINEGYDVAEYLILDLYNTYRRDDLSVVFSGIPLGHMEYLRNGHARYEVSYGIGLEDRNYLKYVIDRYPLDAFLDHAFYFLGNYEYVLEIYNQSYIRDVVLYQAAWDATEKKEYARSASYYLILLNQYPYHKRKNEILGELYDVIGKYGSIDTLRSIYKKHEVPKPFLINHILSHIDSYVQYSGFNRVLNAIGEYNIADSMKGRTRHSLKYRNETYDIKYYHFFENVSIEQFFIELDNNNMRDLFHYITDYEWLRYWDDGEKYYDSNQYTDALDRYLYQEAIFNKYKYPIPKVMKMKLDELKDLVQLMKDSTSVGLFNAGIFLRENAGLYYDRIGRNRDAIYFFKKCAERYPNIIEAEKAQFLIATSYRRIAEFKYSKQEFLKFLENYPNSELIDDAYAELGFHYLEIEHDYKKAKEYFTYVIDNYPNKNAADNSLNWLGWYNLYIENYKMAFYYYSLLADNYAKNRLGKVTKNTLLKLKEVLGSKVKVKGIEGIKSRYWYYYRGLYVEEIHEGTQASNIGLKYSDVIKAINGENIRTEYEYNKILEKYKINEEITLTIKRGKKEIKLKARIEEYEVYAKKYQMW